MSMVDDSLRHTYHPTMVAGAWKFSTSGQFGVTRDELIETAKALAIVNMGGGRFVHMYVRSTGHNELGICFVYMMSDEEVILSRDAWKIPYMDFLMRRHGAAVKGYNIGTGVHVIDLA